MGQQVTFLHGHVGASAGGRRFMAKLLQLAMEAEAEAGWGIRASGLFKLAGSPASGLFKLFSGSSAAGLPIGQRTVESISYDARREHQGRQQQHVDTGQSQGREAAPSAPPVSAGGGGGGGEASATGGYALGCHDDVGSVLSASVMLSAPEDYVGGAFQTQRGAAWHNFSLGRGDVLVWRSWERHCVLPVVRGLRHVLVVEWWTGGEVTDKRTAARPEHPNVREHCAAITAESVDPWSFTAAISCASQVAALVYELGTPESEQLIGEAVAYYRRAAALARGAVARRQPVGLLGGRRAAAAQHAV